MCIRDNYWGTPLNIWECACGHRECIGSRAELAEKAGDPKAAEVELHRPYIDEMCIRDRFTITAAYTYAPAGKISIFDYSQIIFATLLGFLLFAEIPDRYLSLIHI